jgi:hypothetical protein
LTIGITRKVKNEAAVVAETGDAQWRDSYLLGFRSSRVACAISPSLTPLYLEYMGQLGTVFAPRLDPASTPLRAVTYVEAPDPDSSSGRWVRSFFRASVAHVE